MVFVVYAVLVWHELSDIDEYYEVIGKQIKLLPF